MIATSLPASRGLYATRRDLRLDAAALAGLIILAAIVAFLRVKISVVPQEDAAMLLRYSQHVAEGHGIVWNVGDGPVDGATDFLFMLLVAAVKYFGAGLEKSCHIVGLVAHLLTVAVVYMAVRRWGPRGRAFPMLAAAYIALGPGVGYIAAGFGTTLFGFAGALTGAAFLASLEHDDQRSAVRVFALSGVVLGLARPEGAFLALFLAIARLGLAASQRRIRIASDFLLIFGGLGSIYFLWHWIHFGHPFPNPLYIRATHGSHITSLRDATKSTAHLLLPLAPAWAAALRWGNRRRVVWFSVPLIAFVLLWIVISHSMNFLLRYQYPLLPLTCVLAGGLLRDIAAIQRTARLVLTPVALALGLWTVTSLHPGGLFGWRATLLRSGVPAARATNIPYQIATTLACFHGYTMVTHEAGILPLYSGWRAIDAWGLNDPVIARSGLTEAYLDQNHPALVSFIFYGTSDPKNSFGARWDQMITLLRRYVTRRGFTLAAAFGDSPNTGLMFYVDPHVERAPEIVDALRRINFATDLAPLPSAR
jgi:hypothetical protein